MELENCNENLGLDPAVTTDLAEKANALGKRLDAEDPEAARTMQQMQVLSWLAYERLKRESGNN